MNKCRPANLRNISLLIAFIFAFTTAQAQLDYEIAKEVTNFSTSNTAADDVVFMDNGIGQLQNGTAEIQISEEIANQIDGNRIEEMVSLSIQLEGDSNGVYVSKKTKNSFIITELQNGSSNATFSYRFVVKK